MTIPLIDDKKITELLSYPELVQSLEEAFYSGHIHTPPRSHFTVGSGTFLVMPSWEQDSFFGVKVVSVFPENKKLNKPSIQGQFILIDARSGDTCCLIDAKMLTNVRTAAASALASKHLSNPASRSLLMVGTGSLAPHLIHAHAAIRPLQRIRIWGRSNDKAKQLASRLSNRFPEVEAIEDIDTGVQSSDIISCATFAKQPLIKGQLLQRGTHLDLVGSFLPDHREADDTCIRRGQLFVDTEMAIKESGDVAIPISKGIIEPDDIIDLQQLLRSQRTWDKQTITIFKSVGHASEDLVAGKLLFDKLLSQ